MIPLLRADSDFPPLSETLTSPNGLLAAGGDLSAARLLDAYRHGIFPWFSEDDPILWWSPDPRMVLIPSELKISHSLRKTLRRGAFEIRTDSAFEQVMRACAAPRDGEGGGTWITDEMVAAYCELHRLGYSHSVEVWMPKESFQLQIEGETRRQQANDEGSARSTTRSERGSQRRIADELELAGGLYGVAIGKMFYGESMFSRRTDASKIAFAHLARQLESWKFEMIDCQMYTPHLASLGAREIPRAEFIASLQELINCAPVTDFKFDTDLFR